MILISYPIPTHSIHNLIALLSTTAASPRKIPTRKNTRPAASKKICIAFSDFIQIPLVTENSNCSFRCDCSISQFIDRSMVTLYNMGCKFPVKKMEKNELRLLIVEDEKQICDTVAKSLYGAGYEVDTCYDGEEALECILAENYDLIVLDLNLPGMDGMEILKELRQRNEETKVLILSARSQIADKVEGLDAGANDYMEKPFHLQELEARIRSLTRRKFVQKDVCLESGGIKFDTIKREAYAKGKKVSLTRKENGILEYLLLNLGRPVSQEELMEHVWDASADSFSGAIRVHMSSLRKKLKAVLGYDPILNKVGEGYQIREVSDR